MRPLNLLSIFLCLFTLLVCEVRAQSKTVSLSNGDGWYRLVVGGQPRAGGMVRISGGLGNNRITLITVNASFMGYDQQGSITIVDNLYYNTNHVDKIRCGSIGSGLSALDFHIVGIVGTPNLLVEVDGINLSIPDTPAFEPSVPTGLTEISGRVLGISSDRWPVYLGSKVGIGTETTGPHRLAVEGSIGAREVKVQAGPGWPDYVFSPDYELRTLEETKAYIETNQHLPEIPSAKEIEASGVALGEMNMLLLRKIEELTLYVIEQNEIIAQLKEERTSSPDPSGKKLEELTRHLIRLEKENQEQNQQINQLKTKGK